MFLSEDLRENLLIFSNNISYYYVFCVIISLVAVFVACFCQKNFSEVEIKREEKFLDGLENMEEDKSGQSASDENSELSQSVDNGGSVGTASSSLGNDSPATSVDSSANSSNNSVVTTEREMLMDTIVSQMTPEEIVTEREIERQQLEEIFKLVNEQKDVFKIDSLEDLEDQMKLYR